ncbi:hypothetical protein, partial [Aquamicrobium defluvii]|uniref:hypothetical protein n=1 Tax=Aquamicrobium defluvii TaxID=69279 RepID=UPI001AEBBA59
VCEKVQPAAFCGAVPAQSAHDFNSKYDPLKSPYRRRRPVINAPPLRRFAKMQDDAKGDYCGQQRREKNCGAAKFGSGHAGTIRAAI